MKEKTFQSLKWRLSDRLRDAQIEGSLAVVVGVQEQRLHPTSQTMHPSSCSRFEVRIGTAIVDEEVRLADVERDWSAEAKGLLKAELKRRGLTYADLVRALAEVGVVETEANLRNKISRGNFSAAFMLQALSAIGCTVIHLLEPTIVSGRARVPSSIRGRLLASRKAVSPPLDE